MRCKVCLAATRGWRRSLSLSRTKWADTVFCCQQVYCYSGRVTFERTRAAGVAEAKRVAYFTIKHLQRWIYTAIRGRHRIDEADASKTFYSANPRKFD